MIIGKAVLGSIGLGPGREMGLRIGIYIWIWNWDSIPSCFLLCFPVLWLSMKFGMAST